MKKYTIENLMTSYYELKDKEPNLTPFVILSRCVKGKKYTTPAISQAFDEVMETSDYLKSERKDIIKHLKAISDEVPEKV